MPLNQSRAIGIIRYEPQVGLADISENDGRLSDIWRRLVESPALVAARRAVSMRSAKRATSVSHDGDDVAPAISVVRADLTRLTRDLDDEFRGMLVHMAGGDYSGA